MDPCELRQAHGDDAVRNLIARRVPLFEFAINSVIANYDITAAEGRVNALNQVAPLIGKIRDASLRPEYVRLLAGWLGMEVDIVSTAVKRSGGSSAAPSERKVNLTDPILVLEREVLKVKLQLPQLAHSWVDLEPTAFSFALYDQLRKLIDAQEVFNIQELIESSDTEELKSLVTELTVEPIRTDGEVSDRYITSIFARLREVALSRSIAEIKSTLQRLNPVENDAQYQEIFGELVGMEAARRVQKELALGES
jgi:DNA primase